MKYSSLNMCRTWRICNGLSSGTPLTLFSTSVTTASVSKRTLRNCTEKRGRFGIMGSASTSLQYRSMIWRSNNKRGFDPSLYDDEPDPNNPRIEVSMEDVEASIEKERREKRKAHAEFLKRTRTEVQPTESDPYPVIDWEKYFEDYYNESGLNEMPENIKGYSCTWSYIFHPPYLGASKEDELREQPSRTVECFIPVDQFNWTPTQFERFKHLVSTRYKPKNRELVLKSSKCKSTRENVDRVKHMFSTLLDEVKAVE